MTDHTHAPDTFSWVASANAADSDFPLQNLPLCVFRPSDAPAHAPGRIGVGIGDRVLDLPRAALLLPELPPALVQALQAPRLNGLLAQGRPALRQLRHAVWALLRAGDDRQVQAEPLLLPQAEVSFGLPCDIGDYTDFFASHNHARNTFNLFRPGQVFLPNFTHLPIAYHGRSSSVVESGRPVVRPWGQTVQAAGGQPEFGPSRKLDFEVELGFHVTTGNPHGERVALVEAEQFLGGVSVLNDWSARDVQAFESQPLGPFLSKNFSSSLAPWVVTLDALEPFRAPRLPRAADAPPLQSYLEGALDAARGAFDIRLDTFLQSAAMRGAGMAPVRISTACFARDVCWTPAQMVAHHTVGGCNLRPGDLIGTGTISGRDQGTEGSMLELTANGARPLQLPDGETRAFLHDGDEITITAWCEREGFRRIGLGRCTARIQPARSHA
ncbi:fumarylacetoacetase [Pseudacidovorax sp. RU35E]|uniref:fumarylacetoacetase n=1 Tax=Pseudacidovorax sp. RU35E TaxID=1907403 RepID=UPI00095724A9|nr:fumarylacetoacetase [Pseudacidovorax sp. RU35E]SIR72819.1 fumarylacetoacetate hydrolase [Pseudacidovorax sp. RU35E]